MALPAFLEKSASICDWGRLESNYMQVDPNGTKTYKNERATGALRASVSWLCTKDTAANCFNWHNQMNES